METINNNDNKNSEVFKDYIEDGDTCIWYKIESNGTFKHLFLNSMNLNKEYILRAICKKENIGFIDKYELNGFISKDCHLTVKKK